MLNATQAKVRNIEVTASARCVDDVIALLKWGFTPQEQMLLDAIPEKDRDAVLDIGVGAGRTTPVLSSAFKRYVGLDVSEPSVDEAKKRFPGLEFSTQDIRDIDYVDEFSCAFFSFNGIDLVDFVERERVFEKIWKALRPGGYFIYSTHSLINENADRWVGKLLVYELKGPNVQSSVGRVWNRCRLFWRGGKNANEGFAVLNDPALDFSLLLVYVDPEAELKRLKRAGFETLLSIGNQKLAPGFDSKDNFIHFLARKPL